MDTPVRLLRLLALLTARGSWSGGELAERLEVTERTLRRDVTRLRVLGYPVDATTGPYGGYSLAAGGRLPPLLLDDEEAVAVAVALHGVAAHTGSGATADRALSALTKLTQVMPASLRERVVALGEVSLGLRARDRFASGPPGVDVLMGLALACRRSERVRFDYVSAAADDQPPVETLRHVEPFRLVTVGRRWYLVAHDLDRTGWRTFRVDRISRLRNTGARFVLVDPPDAAQQVAEGLAVHSYVQRSVVRLLAPIEEVLGEVAPTIGRCTVDPDRPDATLVEIGGDGDWVAGYLAGLPYAFEVVEPPSLLDDLRRLGERLCAYAQPPVPA